MDTFFRKHSNVLTLTGLIVVQLLGLAIQVKRTTEEGLQSNMLHMWAVKMIAPIEKGFVHSQERIGGLWHDYIYLRGLRSENTDLKQQLDQIRVQNARLQEDALQARRIQALLGFKEQFIHKTVAAQVIGTSGSELSRVIYIDRGSQDGVKPDMAVITPEGIVGKVLRVQSTTSQVLEITDQTSGVGGLLVKSRLQGIAKGTPGGEVVFNNIMSDEKVAVGDPVTTSGGDRIFPKGLPVGTISGVFPGHDVFLNIRLKPAANLNQLEEVLVITEVTEQAPDTKDLGPIRASDILAARLPTVPQTATSTDANSTGDAKPAGTQTPNKSNETPAVAPKKETNAAKPPAGAAAPGTNPAGTNATGVKKQETPPKKPATSEAPKQQAPTPPPQGPRP